MHGYFITGTDTGIGKTVFSALLLAELRRRGTDAVPMKPIQTGCEEGGVPDLDYALAMAGLEVSEADYHTMAPYTFEPPCSPHLAADMVGTEIDIAEVVIAARTLAAEHELVLAEGAGGILVPLNRRETMLDLMQAMKLPVILAARAGLGTINHTLLSLRTLRTDGLDVAGVVFLQSTPDGPSFIEEDNVETIRQFGHVPILGTIPYCADLSAAPPAFEALSLPVAAEIEKIVEKLNP